MYSILTKVTINILILCNNYLFSGIMENILKKALIALKKIECILFWL